MDRRRDIHQEDLSETQSTMQQNYAGANVDMDDVNRESRDASLTGQEYMDQRDIDGRGGELRADIQEATADREFADELGEIGD